MLIRSSIRRDHVISTWKRFSCKFYCSVCSVPTTPALFVKLLVPYSDCFVDDEPFPWLLWGLNWSQIGKNRFWHFGGLQWRVFFCLTWDLIHFIRKFCVWHVNTWCVYCPLGCGVVHSGTNCAAVGGTVLFAFSVKKGNAGAIFLQNTRRQHDLGAALPAIWLLIWYP